MYFSSQREIKICDLINKDYMIYAHQKDDKNEMLEDHIKIAMKYFYKIVFDKYIHEVFEKIELEFFKGSSVEARDIYKEMIINTITLHDIGKVNPYYQKSKLKNDLNIKECGKYKNSNHSMLSSIIYIDVYFTKIKRLEGEERNTLLNFMMMNAYVISRHHGYLNSWADFKKKFGLDGEGYKLIDEQKVLYEKTLDKKFDISIQKIKRIFEIIKKNNEKYTKEQLIYRYLYERLVLSILFACDFYSTSEFMSNFEVSEIGIVKDIDEFYNVFKDGEVYQLIRKYKKEEYGKIKNFSNIKDINILRNEMFLDAEKTLKKNIESNIFYLEGPTGSGKSNVATNLCFQLLKEDQTKNKIFYVYPFNTLVEQNIVTLKKVFDKEDDILNKITVINSIEPIKFDEEISESEDTHLTHYKKALLNRQFLNYPMILTTHVTIFKYLFGTSKEDVFPLHQLANSVIVLDEIQSYKNLIWGEIITFLTCYAKVLNMKIIIMSATLPDLDKLSISKGNTVKLIEDREKYFENPIFKNRVEVDYTLLESENIKDDLYNHVKKKSHESKKILLEFISKNSAYSFYNRLKEDDEILCDVELMSGDDNIGERARIINNVEKMNSIILVATQVVEAGVDIDMDFGYKNISLLDSEEQFLGRINRSCKKDGCIVYFFKIDEAKKIYKNDVRRNQDITLENEDIKKILKEKKFDKFYDLVIERLKSLTSGFNDLNIKDFFQKNVKELEFNEVEERLRLISKEDSKISVYLSSDLIVSGEELKGEALWNDYKELLLDKTMDYAKRRVKLSLIKSKMSNFIYEVKWSYNFTYNDRLGDLYFIEDGNKYFKDGKLDKEKFKNGIGDFL